MKESDIFQIRLSLKIFWVLISSVGLCNAAEARMPDCDASCLASSAVYHTSFHAIKNKFVRDAAAVISPCASEDEFAEYIKSYSVLWSGSVEHGWFSALGAAWANVKVNAPEVTQEQAMEMFNIALNSGLNWHDPNNCSYRVIAAGNLMAQAGYAYPASGFAFGRRFFYPQYGVYSLGWTLIGNSVRWRYHVAPEINIDGVPYIIDPAIHSLGPIPKATWLASMRGVGSYTTCSPGVVLPGGRCY